VDLVVLAKEPVPGRVKTRLCPPCSPAEAAAVAEAALADTVAAACASGADRVVLALDGRPGEWCPPGVRIVDQGTGPLAARLGRAWSHVAGPALQVGMDTPQVTPGELASAMTALVARGTDAVLGPAVDGGWWAIGMRRSRPRVFAGVAMSQPDTGARQAARLAALGLRTRYLPERRDVDSWPDALAVAAEAGGSRFASVVRGLVGAAA
jgi:glycosyltransferase A (GT-A) superfamily protein (DUF2064 family)